MFQNDYKKDMDKIKPDGFIKYRIKQRLSAEESTHKNKAQKLYFVKAAAAVLCIALVFTLGAVVGRHTAPVAPMLQNANVMETANDYDKIYSTLSDFKQSFWDELKEYAYSGFYKDSNEMIIEEYAASADDFAKPTDDNAAVSGTGDSSHSETTAQVDGVDEADIVKTDGKYIYIISQRDDKEKIKIAEAGQAPKQLSDIVITEDVYINDLYLNDNRLVILCGVNGKAEIMALIYDVSNPNNPKKLQSCSQSGSLNTSRLIGNKLYIISNFYVNVNNMIKSDTESYIPYIKCGEYNGSVAADTVHFYDDCKSPEYTIISAFNIKDSTLISTQSVLGGTETVYSSTDNIIAAGRGGNDKTQIARFEILDGKIELKASSELNGRLLNQFSIDEYKGHFRFVLTENKNTTINSLIILDNDLKETGKITDIAPDEKVYSVRFMGDTAYFVTFRQVDPLFSVDVSNPENPKIIGALKIPGFSNFLFPYGAGKLLGIGQNADEKTGRTGNMKLSMFDISNPANVTESDKTDIPALYSESLYNHKAVLADYNRNIIAFSAYSTYKQSSFFVYSYENGEFIKKLETETDNTGVCRGIFIGKRFYIVTDCSINYYDISSFEKIGTLKLS